jgi:hypothetical protein
VAVGPVSNGASFCAAPVIVGVSAGTELRRERPRSRRRSGALGAPTGSSRLRSACPVQYETRGPRADLGPSRGDNVHEMLPLFSVVDAVPPCDHRVPRRLLATAGSVLETVLPCR